MHTLSPAQTRRLRLRAQQLSGSSERRSASVAELLRQLGGVQAQERPAAALALRARRPGLLAAEVTAALEQERSVVRTWCMRGTLHLLLAADLGWLLPLFGPLFIRKGRRRRAELGLDEAACARASSAFRDWLGQDGPLTRPELAQRLAAISIPSEGQATYHLIHRAALEGVLCYGPERTGEPTYALLENWAPPAVAADAAFDDDEAVRRLALRYLAAYGPAGPEDMASWSGLPMRPVRAAFAQLAPDLAAAEIEGALAWLLPEQADLLDEPPPAEPVVNLAPAYDAYLLGYRDRSLSLPADFARRVHPGGGLLRPAVLVDGLAAGTWRLQRRGTALAVVVAPFTRFSEAVRAGIDAEVAEIGRFYGQAVAWTE